MDSPDKLVAIIAKNSREEFRVQLRSFKGYRSADLRIFALNSAGEMVATGKGVSVKPGTLRTVIEALKQAEAAAIEEGLIDG